jgi:phosphate:Na+ symporter
MATSLMNDSAYAYDISKNLITMTEIIFANKDNADLGISEEDIDTILNKNKKDS